MRTYTGEEIGQIERETLVRIQNEPRVESVRFVAETGEMEFSMVGGSRIVVPARSLRGLTTAIDESLRR